MTKFEILFMNFLKSNNLINPDGSMKELSFDNHEELRKMCISHSKEKRKDEIQELLKNPKIKKRLRKLKLKQIEGKDMDIDDKILSQLLNNDLFNYGQD